MRSVKNDSKRYETGVLLLPSALLSAPDIGQGLWCMKRTKIVPERFGREKAIAPPSLAPLTSEGQRRLAVLQSELPHGSNEARSLF